MGDDFREYLTVLIGAGLFFLAVIVVFAVALAGRATYLLFNLDTVCEQQQVEQVGDTNNDS